jgi:hypothetical protein
MFLIGRFTSFGLAEELNPPPKKMGLPALKHLYL